MPNSNVQKGKQLENYVVDRLRTSGLDLRAARNPGSGNGKQKGDIWNDLGLSIECKNQKSFKKEWMKQSERDSLGYTKPIVVWHLPNTPIEDSTVWMPWNFFEELLKKAKEPVMTQPDRAMKWKLQKLKVDINEVLKEIQC